MERKSGACCTKLVELVLTAVFRLANGRKLGAADL
jgi:hypothetical protein